MEELINILNEIDDSIDYTKEKALINDRLLTSLHVISLVAELEDFYGVTIGPAEMTPENFNSAESIMKMIERLK